MDSKPASEAKRPLLEHERLALEDALGGRRAMETYTESRFSVTEKNRSAHEAVLSFNPSRDNLYLFGPAGCGKSHLAAIALRRNWTTKTMRNVGTVTQMEISRLVRSAQSADAEQDIISAYAYKPVLCIDDLGIAKDTDFMMTLIYEVIHARYMNMPGGLVVTSNLGLDALAQKFGDDRISSRLAQMCKVFNLSGETDYRLKKAFERKAQ